jgi:hypothetical protein
MGGALLSSKIVNQEEEPSLRAIPATKTAVIAAIGITERGPIGVATLCQSWEDYVKNFGSFLLTSDLPLAIWGIYQQDRGAWVYVTRTVHYTDLDAPTHTGVKAAVNIPGTSAVASAGAVTGSAAAPINLEPGQTLDIHVDEDGGGSEVATFDAARATRAGSGLAIVALNTLTLLFKIDGGDQQTVTFTAAETTVALVVDKINDTILNGVAVVNAGEVDIRGSIRGTSGSVEIVGGTALTEIGHTVGTTSGSGDVANINAVTLAEIQAVIAADITTATITVTQEGTGEITLTSDTSGVSSSVQVEVASTATGFGFDNLLHSGTASTTSTTLIATGADEGTYFEALRVVIAAASNGVATYFNMTVQTSAGIILETFPNCQSADDSADDFVEAVVTRIGSRYMDVADQATTVRPDNGTYTPTGGDDGLTSIDANDYLGTAAGQTGIHSFDTVETITILTIPGQSGSALHNGMLTYCETDREGLVFAVLDPPASQTPAQIVTYVKTTAALKGASEFGAIYWPEIKVQNPNKTIFGTGDTVTVPPAAWVAGVYSKVDDAREGGIYDPPAGVERGRITGLQGFENDDVLREEVRDLIVPELINPITALENHGRFIDGVETLKADGNFPTIAERRGVSYMQSRVKDGTQFARHSNNDASLRARLFRTVFNFLRNQMMLGAFRTKEPQTAFFVDVSEALNPPSEVALFKVNGRIGLATQKPAKFIIWSWSQDTRALDDELAG